VKFEKRIKLEIQKVIKPRVLGAKRQEHEIIDSHIETDESKRKDDVQNSAQMEQITMIGKSECLGARDKSNQLETTKKTSIMTN